MVTQSIERKVEQGGRLDSEDLLLLKVLAELEGAPETTIGGEVVHRGDEDVPPMVTTKPRSAGYVWLRRNSDGKLVEINRNQLPQRLRQKLPDGRHAWLAPSAPWNGRRIVGTKLCLLHVDHQNRERMDALGLDVCKKQGMTNDAIVRRHVMKKHKDAWEAIQRDETERREDARDRREELMSAALQRALTGGVAPTTAAVSPEAEPEDIAGTEVQTYTRECEVCHVEFESKTSGMAAMNLAKHMKREHGISAGAK